MVSGFHLFADVAKYGRTYNRHVERSGDGKPSVGSYSQSVSINENVFQSFNSYAKAGWATNQWTCRANFGLLRDSMMLSLRLMLGDVGFGWEFDSMGSSGKESKTSKAPGGVCHWHHGHPVVFKQLGGRSGEAALILWKGKKDAEGPSLDESWENEGIWMSIVVIQIPKNVKQ
ncbi:hypothetical protein Tco_0482278 [Tanacetum coccineum]